MTIDGIKIIDLTKIIYTVCSDRISTFEAMEIAEEILVRSALKRDINNYLIRLVGKIKHRTIIEEISRCQITL